MGGVEALPKCNQLLLGHWTGILHSFCTVLLTEGQTIGQINTGDCIISGRTDHVLYKHFLIVI